jgi:hypothetical protein
MKDDHSKLSSEQHKILRESPWVKARRELVEMGLVRDSGRRRDGMIVWELTPLGKMITREQRSVRQAA